MRQLPHGYTNNTVGDGHVVVKTYAGPDAATRRARELAVLTRLAGRLPLPPVLDADDRRLRLGYVDGVHGQELLVNGVTDEVAAAVLAACGTVLARVHTIRADPLGGARGLSELGSAAHPAASVLVHGDFGPNNVLVTPGAPDNADGMAVAAILDWEFARFGSPIDDLAWCEWVIRTHHPDRVDLLGSFFDAYGGGVPGWPTRQAAMIARCTELIEFCDRWESGGGDLWRRRAADVATWTE